MTSVQENFQQLTRHIEDLGPGEIEGELKPLFGDGGRGALSGAIARYHLDPTDPNDPMAGLMGSIHEAIRENGVAEDGEDMRPILGARTVEAVTTALQSSEFQPKSITEIEWWAERANDFMDLLDGDEDEHVRKSSRLVQISQAVTAVGTKHGDRLHSAVLFQLAGKYLDKAAEAAANIEDPAERTLILMSVAKQSIRNFEQAVDSFGPQAAGHLDSVYIDALPTRLYGEALVASRSLEEPVERFEVKSELVLNVVEVAIELREFLSGPASNLGDNLLNLAETGVDELLSDDTVTGVWRQGYYLASLGKGLAKVINKNYYEEEISVSEEDRIPKIEELEERMFAAFKATGEKARDATRLQEDDRIILSLPQQVMPVASMWLQRDFSRAKELVGIALDLAAAEARVDDRYAHGMHGVIDDIGQMAEGVDAAKALELFLKAHEAENQRVGGVPEDATEAKGNAIAQAWISDITDRSSVKLPELDSASNSFIKFAMQTTEWVNDLRILAKIFEDEPELQQFAKESMTAMLARETEAATAAEESQSKTERIAQELVRSLVDQQAE